MKYFGISARFAAPFGERLGLREAGFACSQATPGLLHFIVDRRLLFVRSKAFEPHLSSPCISLFLFYDLPFTKRD